MLCNPDPLALTLLNYPAVLALHHHSSDWFLHFNSLPVSSDTAGRETSPEFALSRFAFFSWLFCSNPSGSLCFKKKKKKIVPNPALVQLIQVAILEQKLWSKWKEMPLRDQKRSPAEGPGKEEKEEEKQSRAERGDGARERGGGG